MSYFKKCENGITLNVYVLPGTKSQEISPSAYKNAQNIPKLRLSTFWTFL